MRGDPSVKRRSVTPRDETNETLTRSREEFVLPTRSPVEISGSLAKTFLSARALRTVLEKENFR